MSLFRGTEVVIHSFYKKIDYTYSLDRATSKEAVDPDRKSVPSARSSLAQRLSKQKLLWHIDPPDGGAWYNRFLPTTRLYTLPKAMSAIYGYSPQPEHAEAQLEASFVEILTDTWRDYTAELAQKIKEVQEAGLAKILKSVISPTESHFDDPEADPDDAYKAVSQFLARRKMSEDSPSEEEFHRRYRSEVQFKNVSRHIEAIERDIAHLMAPREMFERVVNDLFLPGKHVSFGDKEIGVAIGDKNIGLATLSSGEKHLLRILVETIVVRSAPMLIDEPELSMHVDWQRRLISTMRVLNPASQMILATHSPEIMAELPDADIFRI
jgi:hypothetical protein